jgi:hypothetical protein
MATWLIALAAGGISGILMNAVVVLIALRFMARERLGVRTDYSEDARPAVSVPPAPSTLIAQKLRLMDGINRRRRRRWEGWR